MNRRNLPNQLLFGRFESPGRSGIEALCLQTGSKVFRPDGSGIILDRRALPISRRATCVVWRTFQLQVRNLVGSGRLLEVMLFGREMRSQHRRFAHTCDSNLEPRLPLARKDVSHGTEAAESVQIDVLLRPLHSLVRYRPRAGGGGARGFYRCKPLPHHELGGRKRFPSLQPVR